MTTRKSSDARLAAELAVAAGELLVHLRAEDDLSGTELGDAGDMQANDLLIERLRAERPEDAILSEESADDRRRLSSDRVWIIDPLDGTREYRTEGRQDWAVHVALWHSGSGRRGSGLVAGAVALPALGVTYDSDGVTGPTDEVGLLEARTSDTPRVVVSGSRPPAFSDAVAEAIGGVVTPLGSAGAKAMAVVRGEADAYVHAGGQYEWDSAAPVVVAQAAGLFCSRIDGSPLRYNSDDVYLPDLLICRPELSEKILRVLADQS